MNLMKNLGDQFGDAHEEEQREEKAKSTASKRPPDIVLEHSNDTYTQRFCMYCSRPSDVGIVLIHCERK